MVTVETVPEPIVTRARAAARNNNVADPAAARNDPGDAAPNPPVVLPPVIANVLPPVVPNPGIPAAFDIVGAGAGDAVAIRGGAGQAAPIVNYPIPPPPPPIPVPVGGNVALAQGVAGVAHAGVAYGGNLIGGNVAGVGYGGNVGYGGYGNPGGGIPGFGGQFYGAGAFNPGNNNRQYAPFVVGDGMGGPFAGGQGINHFDRQYGMQGLGAGVPNPNQPYVTELRRGSCSNGLSI